MFNLIYVTERLGPRLLIVDPSGRFVYVANWDLNTISAYRIEDATGALTPITGSPYATGKHPRAVTVDPKGRFIYAANWDSHTISGYTI